MSQSLCLLAILNCYSSFALINEISMEQAPSISQQLPFTSDRVRSRIQSSKIFKNKETNMNWNGGTILTHESNLQSKQYGRSETAIASTRCNNLIFVAFNSAQGFCFNNNENNTECRGVPHGFDNGFSHYTVSLDAGKTWKYMYAPPPLDTDVFLRGDPWLSMGGKSSKNGQELLYFANIASNKSTQITDHLGLSVHVAKIIYKNNNPRKRAINFEWIRVSLIPKIKPDDFLDKESIAADPFDATKAYVSLILFGANRVNVEVYATHNAAVSWQGPVILQETVHGLPVTYNHYPFSAVGANGDVYVVWFEFLWDENVQRNLKYMLMKSSDGGITFPDAPISINPEFINFNPRWKIPIAHNRERLPAQPTMDIFTTSRNRKHDYLNRIIVAYAYALTDVYNGHTGFIADNSSFLDSINIGVSYSDDLGATWNYIDPFEEQIADRFIKRIFPTVSVSLDGKSVNIGYLEVREVKMTDLSICKPVGVIWRTSFYHDIVDTYYIHSDNGGITWSDPIKLNEESVDWCDTASHLQPNYGDYMLGVSDSRGGIQLAGVTNGFTKITALERNVTVVDVTYYHATPTKKKCNNGRRWSKTYNMWINEQHKEQFQLLDNLEHEEKNEHIVIDLSWKMIAIGVYVIGIAICFGSPFVIWIKMNRKE